MGKSCYSCVRPKRYRSSLTGSEIIDCPVGNPSKRFFMHEGPCKRFKPRPSEIEKQEEFHALTAHRYDKRREIR